MISDYLQRLAAEIFINILGRLFRSEVRSGKTILAECFVVQCEERAITVQTSFDALPAEVTLVQVIAYRQQLRGG